MDPLTILLLTYGERPERREYAYLTLHSVLDNLRYSGPLMVHIADDGSPDEHRSVLQAIAGGYAHVQAVTVTNAERAGYGASYNLATQVVHLRGGLVLPLEDDWQLMRELNVDELAPALGGAIGCIRLGYLGYTQALRGEIIRGGGEHNYLLLDENSPERHVCAGHPRLETVEWERAVGPWPVGYDAGTTEFIWCGLPAARQHVAWPLDLIGGYGSLFAHVGAVQARHDQEPATA